MAAVNLSSGAVLVTASKMGVVCGGCGSQAHPRRVLGVCVRPQWDTAPFAMVEFRCDTPDCDTLIPVEVDV